MTLSFDVQTVRVAEFLEDTAYARWSQAQIGKYLNDAQRDFARGSRILRKQSSALAVVVTTPTNAFYTLPTDFLGIESGQVWDATSAPSIQLQPATVDQLGDNWDAVTGGRPIYYIALEEFGITQLRVWPTPPAALTALTMYYSYLPADLTGSQSSAIPEQYRMAMVYYATAMCLMQLKQQSLPGTARDFMGMYERELDDARANVARRFSSQGAYVRYRHV